jgi:hypothetical protein
MFFPAFIYVLYSVCADTDVRSDMSNVVAISGKDVPKSGHDVTTAIQTLFPTSPELTNNTTNSLTGYSMSLTVRIVQMLHAAKISDRNI